MTIFPVDSHGRLYQKAASRCGAVAQLGERLNGIQEVRGSIPRSSTTYTPENHYVYLNAETTKPSAMTAFLFVPGQKIIQNLSKVGTISVKG